MIYAKPRYHREKAFVNDMTICTRHMHNGDEIGLDQRQRAMVRSLHAHATPRQREMLYLYYAQGLPHQAIAKYMGIESSTVSRTIQRGERWARQAAELFD